MSLRTSGVSLRHARNHARRMAVAASVAVALTVGVVPAMADPAPQNEPVSAWGKDGEKAKMPPGQGRYGQGPGTGR